MVKNPKKIKIHNNKLHQIFRKIRPKLIVMASNTPSVQIYDEIKNEFSVEIIPTKPPLKKAIKMSKKKHIAIMASNEFIA